MLAVILLSEKSSIIFLYNICSMLNQDTSMDEKSRPVQSPDNQILLNAIKNKFGAQNNKADFKSCVGKDIGGGNPLVFPSNSKELQGFVTLNNSSASSSPTLNQFILSQLNSKHQEASNEVTAGDFTLPKLQFHNSSSKEKFTIPLLTDKLNKVVQIRGGLSTLKISEDESKLVEPPTIDLKSALSSSLENTPIITASPSIGTRCSKLDNKEDDDNNIELLNERCQSNLATIKLRHSLVAPSACGRLICLGFSRKRWRIMPPILPNSSLVVSNSKHKILRFNFDTKSPDDIVLAKLNRFARDTLT